MQPGERRHVIGDGRPQAWMMQWSNLLSLTTTRVSPPSPTSEFLQAHVLENSTILQYEYREKGTHIPPGHQYLVREPYKTHYEYFGYI